MNSPSSWRRDKGRRESGTALLFLAPSLLGLAVFVLVPFVDTIRRSFCNALGNRWTGLENYRQVLDNGAFRLAAQNTARFLGVCLPLLLAASLLLALLVRGSREKHGLFQTTFLVPMAVPVSAIVLLWKVLFSDNGLINGILSRWGREPVSFLSTDAAFWVLVATYLWKNAGYDMILWLAGLDNISAQLYESASVDGANAFQQFRYVTLPGIAPMAGVVGLLSLINTFKVFREAYLVAGGYPHNSIYLLQHLFNNWFLELDMGRITAAAVLMVLVLMGVILLARRFWQLEDPK